MLSKILKPIVILGAGVAAGAGLKAESVRVDERIANFRHGWGFKRNEDALLADEPTTSLADIRTLLEKAGYEGALFESIRVAGPKLARQLVEDLRRRIHEANPKGQNGVAEARRPQN
jgi:hypothetical protein